MAVAQKTRPVRKGSPTSKGKSRRGFGSDSRTVWFAAAFLLFSISTFFAFTQNHVTMPMPQ